MRGRDAASAISGGSIGAQFERGRPHHTAALSDCSLIETTDLPEGESSRASYLPQGLTSHRCPQCFRPRPSRSSKPSCDGDDDAWWWTSMEPSGAAMLDSAAGEAIGAASWANAGIANAVAKTAAESTERVRFIFVDLLDIGGP